MRRKIFLAVLVIVSGAAGSLSAQTLFGENYTSLSYSYFDYGDGDFSYLDGGDGASVLVNINHESSMDIQLGFDYVYADGRRNLQDVEISTMYFKADIVHTFCESERARPFFNVGLRVMDMDVTGPATERDDTDAGLGIGIGIEVELAPALMARLSAERDNISHDHHYLTAMLGCWFTDDFLGKIAIGRETESDSNYLQVGAVFVF